MTLNRIVSRAIPRVLIMTIVIATTIVLGCSGSEVHAETAGTDGTDWEYQITCQRGIEAMNWGSPR